MSKLIRLESEDVSAVEHMLESLIAARILLVGTKSVFAERGVPKRSLTRQEIDTLNGSISVGADLLDRMKYDKAYSGIRK